MTVLIPMITACVLSLAVGFALGLNKGRGKCPDKRITGLTFDGCEYQLTEAWKNVTVEVSRCRRCGHVDMSWLKQDDSVQIYASDEEDGDDD